MLPARGRWMDTSLDLLIDLSIYLHAPEIFLVGPATK